MNDKMILKRVTILAKGECANYHGGLCSPEDCKCHVVNPRWPTISEGAIACDYFMDAVLPADRELTKLVWNELTGEDGPTRSTSRICEICGKAYVPTSHRQKYCPDCGSNAKKLRIRAKQRRYDEKKRNEKSA